MRARRWRRRGAMEEAISHILVSNDEQTDSGLGLEAQRQRIAAYRAMKGLHLAEVFEDTAISGGKPLTRCLRGRRRSTRGTGWRHRPASSGRVKGEWAGLRRQARPSSSETKAECLRLDHIEQGETEVIELVLRLRFVSDATRIVDA